MQVPQDIAQALLAYSRLDPVELHPVHAPRPVQNLPQAQLQTLENVCKLTHKGVETIADQLVSGMSQLKRHFDAIEVHLYSALLIANRQT